jgi:hypothetical protein
VGKTAAGRRALGEADEGQFVREQSVVGIVATPT